MNLALPLAGDMALFVIAAIVIGVAGVKSASYADRLADRTGLGEALTGTIFLGFLTALPGLAASITAAVKGHPDMAIGNAIGGIAVQTTALAVADIAYPRANLEHAAASLPNMMQATLLIALLVLVMTGLSGPELTVAHIHPITIILIVSAASAFYLILKTRDEPMWKPTRTDETVTDVPDERHMHLRLRSLISGLVVTAVITGLAGVLVAEATENIVEKTKLSTAVAGGLLMAVATSLPEMVTSIAAVRRGALTLAVSDIVGGNLFDVLFVAAADLVYLKGSLYHAPDVGHQELFLTSVTILMNVVLLAGLIYRQKGGPGNIGFESLLMLLLYFCGSLVLMLTM